MIIDKRTLATLSMFTTQFVIIRPVFSILLCILELLGMHTPPLSYVFPVIFNISVYLAIYALLQFYHAFAEELAPHNPLGKFLCIKGVVFFAFWQVSYIGVGGCRGWNRTQSFSLQVQLQATSSTADASWGCSHKTEAHLCSMCAHNGMSSMGGNKNSVCA